MTETVDTEIELIPQIAKLYIRQKVSDTLPKELHDTLNNIFTKGHKESTDKHVSNSRLLEYRKAIIAPSLPNYGKRVEHRVIRGRRASIYNALCLYTLVGTAGTKKIFQEYYVTKSSVNKREFKLLDLFAKKELSAEMLFFGVSQSSFDNIKNKLIDDNFNLFTEQLPSPFQSLKASHTDLSPLGVLYDRDVNWHSFIESYIKADKKLKSKECMEAKSILQNVTDKRLLQLPLVKELTASIDSQIDENKDAWEYLQNILS
ncbi:hypothetical protein H5187_20760 [Pseudoalteromonas sp. SG44-1]|uniref:hypothetical protein n=1 Tax=Pseudoalteromonas sp. SG44-1 TaxID=2760964 RepID=UPI001600C99C|nr:hypothetical protein [Pseudoalteromonas sp. SG44-1]MBB1419678.1 hypothetical protein [Pseudoalteromonas sp. SG44-1]